jgi:hypothetical protein
MKLAAETKTKHRATFLFVFRPDTSFIRVMIAGLTLGSSVKKCAEMFAEASSHIPQIYFNSFTGHWSWGHCPRGQ